MLDDALALQAARPQVPFILEKDRGRTHRYICGGCGADLMDRATCELLDCIFLCSDCGAINESPQTH